MIITESPAAVAATALSERAVLAAIVRGGAGVAADIATRITPGDFAYTENEVAFRGFRRIAESGIAPTPTSLRELLTDAVNADPRRGGIVGDALTTDDFAARFVASLFDEPPSVVANAAFHAGRIADAALLRRAAAAARRLQILVDDAATGANRNDAGDDHAVPCIEELIGRMQGEVLSLGDPSVRAKPTAVPELLPDFYRDLWAEYELPSGTLRGVDTGFPTLNRLTHGFRPGSLIVIAAGSGVGKSAIALNHVAGSCRNAKKRVGWQIFTYEMPQRELLERATFSDARVSTNRFASRSLSPADIARLRASQERIADLLSLTDIHDDPTYSVTRICSICRAKRARGRCDAVLVDYAQLVPSDPAAAGRNDNREREVAKVAHGLKQLAIELNVPVIALSQLNDDGKLRESRVLEQNASLILHLESQAQEGRSYAEDEGKPHRLTIKKNRHGNRSGVALLYFGAMTRFDEEFGGEHDDGW